MQVTCMTEGLALLPHKVCADFGTSAQFVRASESLPKVEPSSCVGACANKTSTPSRGKHWTATDIQDLPPQKSDKCRESRVAAGFAVANRPVLVALCVTGVAFYPHGD